MFINLTLSMAASPLRGNIKTEVASPQSLQGASPQSLQDRTGSSRPSEPDLVTSNHMLKRIDFVCPIQSAGGVLQLLEEHVRDHCQSSKENLASRLSAFFEPKIDISYTDKDQLQLDLCSYDDKEYIMRLVDLGFGQDATTCGAPRLHTSLNLLDAILTDGFVTQGDPLLIWMNPETLKLDKFWMSYVKGHARACTALAVAVIVMDHFKDPSALQAAGGSNLLESLRAIRVRVNPVAPDMMSVAFRNALLAHRGSIRQAHDVLNWIQKLDKVSAATGQPAEDVLQRWNQQCPDNAKVVGNKRLCCFNILKAMSVEARAVLIEHASKYGSNGAFTDDAFTSKKVLPGYKPRLQSNPKWTRWLTVTNDSLKLMLQHVIRKHEDTNAAVRCKIQKQKLERASDMAALVSHIAEDVLEANPSLPRDQLWKTFIESFINNEPNIVMALEDALTDQTPTFDVMVLPVLNDMLLEFCKTAKDNGAAAPLMLNFRVEATELQQSEFNLWLMKARMDVESFIAWTKTMKDRETKNYYRRIQHNILRSKECLAAANSLLDPRHENCRVWLIPRSEDRSFSSCVAGVRAHLMKTHMVDSNDVFMLTYVNWTAMCLFNSKTTLAQHRALAELVCQDAGGNSVGLVLLPTHSYKKGVLHKSTAEAQSQIAAHGLNLDRQVCLYFDSAAGGNFGYTRPMMLVGNLVVTTDDSKHTKTLKNVLKNPVLNLGEQPRSKDMVWMDDPDVDALPSSISEDAYVGVQEKHFQIGHVACGKVLNSFLADIATTDSRYGVLLVDLSVHVGDMVKAVVNGAFLRPLMCVGLCDSADAMEFARHEIVHFLKTRLLTDDNFKIPGFVIPPKDSPHEDDEVQPPTLASLVWHGQNVALKDSDRDKYKENFEDQFNELEAALNQAVAYHSIEPAGKGIKRELGSPGKSCGAGQPSPKKLKEGEADNMAQSEPLEFIDPESLKTSILQDVTLAQRWTCGQTKKTNTYELALKICADHQLYIVNTQSYDVELPHGSMFVGFGKGKWTTDCEQDDMHAIPYKLHGSADSVIFNANVTTLGALISSRRLTSDADVARCCYHDLVDDPTDNDQSAFYLRSTQNISYVLSDVPVKAEPSGSFGRATRGIATQAMAGSLIPPEQWNTKFTKMLWVVKWLPKKGLQPVRPQVNWLAPDTVIPAGKALLLAMEPKD